MPWPWQPAMRVTAARLEEVRPFLVEQVGDITVTSSTTLGDTAIVVPVVAGGQYIFRLRVAYGSGAGGARFAWEVPPGTDMVRRVEGVAVGESGAGGEMTMRARAAGTEQVVGGGITFAGYHEDVQVTAGSTGDCRLRFAQGTSSGDPTIFRDRSFVEVLRTA